MTTVAAGPPDLDWVEAPVAPGAPGWWAGNTRVAVADDPRAGGLLRRTPREHRDLVRPHDAAAAFVAAVAAAGLGPRLMAADEDGTLVTARLDDARVATLTRLRTTGSLGSVVDLHRAVGGLEFDAAAVDPVAELARLLGVVARLGTTLPDGAERAVQYIIGFRARLADGPASQPAAGDVTASNVLLGPRGPLLVGGTFAARIDPLATAGMLINEYSPYLADPREVFERFWGSWDAAGYARARLHGIVDHVRWAAVSRIAAALTRDATFPASFPGSIRARLAVAALADPGFDAWRAAA